MQVSTRTEVNYTNSHTYTCINRVTAVYVYCKTWCFSTYRDDLLDSLSVQESVLHRIVRDVRDVPKHSLPQHDHRVGPA